MPKMRTEGVFSEHCASLMLSNIVARAIEMGADVDTAMNENGCTALHIAVHRFSTLFFLQAVLDCFRF
jgi:hypothetical protein